MQATVKYKNMEKEPVLLKDFSEELGVQIKAFDVNGITRFFCPDQNGDIIQLDVKNEEVYDSPFGLVEEMRLQYINFECYLSNAEYLDTFNRNREWFELLWRQAEDIYDYFDFSPIKEVAFGLFRDGLLNDHSTFFVEDEEW